MKTLFYLLSLFLLQSCGGGTTTGNPVDTKLVNVQMQDQQPFAWIKNLSESLIKSAHATTTSANFCFKRLRFKPDSTTEGSNYDLVIGEVVINNTNTNVVSVSVPQGVYRRIEFDLESNCDGTVKPSVTFSNNGSTYSTTDNMTIKFDGTYTVSADGNLVLDIDALFDALDTVSAGTQIKTALEGSTGHF